MAIELVKVKTDDPANNQGFYLLEKQDFNPNKHVLWTPAPPKQPEQPKAPEQKPVPPVQKK